LKRTGKAAVTTQVAHQRFLCALKAHFGIQNALLMRIKSAGVLPGEGRDIIAQTEAEKKVVTESARHCATPFHLLSDVTEEIRLNRLRII